ncbi:MAG: hypothetical protein L0322_17545 [Chloroflexi bacterium]|nr:hypothetical protein [Chloroflexota bacterium]
MSSTFPFEEELFGVLSDDDLYLDCLLVRPPGLADERVESLQVWVPRYPLTKSSVVTCARQEAKPYGEPGRTAHLVFDLRATGESEGTPGDKRFDIDLNSVRAWAQERFGEKIRLAFLGEPDGRGQAALLPIRPGVVVEYYRYPGSRTAGAIHPPVLYLSTYGHFNRGDDAMCQALAEAGYDVYGLDPLRYLLHASYAGGRITPTELRQDLIALCQSLPDRPVIIGQPVAAGLALLWTAGVEAVRGVIAIGKAQVSFAPPHIFQNDNAHTYFLSRHVHRIAPRPVAFVMVEGDPLGGEANEIAAFFSSAGQPRTAERSREVTPALLKKLLGWVEQESPKE